VAAQQRPLSLILARNLLSSISTPGFLVDAHGTLLFFNEACGGLLGRRFEETGKLPPEQWGAEFGPFDDDGRQIPWNELPLTLALRADRAAHSRVCVRAGSGELVRVEISALPIVSDGGFHGALAIFWPSGDSS
jgi:PAS domain-containing protein